MAKATLPTNFKDDILASSMGSKRRYNVINNSDGTISLEDVTTYTQVGSTFGAAQINATNKAANAAADASKIIDDYDTLMANTQAGYMAGALAVKELNSNLGSLETTYFGLLSPNTIYTVDIDWTKNKKILIIFLNNSNSRPEHSEILSVDKSGNVSTIYTTWGTPMYPGYAQISITDSGFSIKQLSGNKIKLYIARIS